MGQRGPFRQHRDAEGEVGENEQNQNDPALLHNCEVVYRMFHNSHGEWIFRNLDPVNNHQACEIEVFLNVYVSRHQSGSSFPIVNGLSEPVLLEACVTEVIVKRTDLNSAIQQPTIVLLCCSKIALLVL